MRFTKAALGEHYQAFVRELEHELRRVSNAERIPLLETAHLFDEEDFIDHCHMSRAGNDKLAAVLAKQIISLIASSNDSTDR